MTTTLIRKKLINYLESADEKKVKAVYTIFKDEIEENSFQLSEEQIKILDNEREKHLSGKNKSYTWDDAKKIIRGQKKK